MKLTILQNKNIVMLCFGLAAVLQIAVPAAMIVRYEMVLIYGKLYKFRTAPVDPYDAFRGRYVALRIKEDSAPVRDRTEFKYNETVYAAITTDKDGFAKFASVSKTPPTEDVDYLKVKVRYNYGEDKVISLEIPFDRYYMNENYAQAAEDAYRQNSRQGKENTYVAVRVKSGKAVIENLFIDNQPVMEYLNQNK